MQQHEQPLLLTSLASMHVDAAVACARVSSEQWFVLSCACMCACRCLPALCVSSMPPLVCPCHTERCTLHAVCVVV